MKEIVNFGKSGFVIHTYLCKNWYCVADSMRCQISSTDDNVDDVDNDDNQLWKSHSVWLFCSRQHSVFIVCKCGDS